MSVEIEVRDDLVVATLRRIEGGIGPEAQRAMRKSVLYVQSQIPPYPPPPPASSYRRTGTLGRTVTAMGSASGPALGRVESAGGTVIGYVGSSVRYAGYVIDEQNQAWMHKDRWWTLQSVVATSRDGIKRIFEDAINRLTR